MAVDTGVVDWILFDNMVAVRADGDEPTLTNIGIHRSNNRRTRPRGGSWEAACRPFPPVVTAWVPAMRLPMMLSFLLAAATLTACSPASAERWKAGVARTVITPEKAVWLAGYGSKRVPDGKLHDLWMKALALEDPEGRRAVLITEGPKSAWAIICL